MEEKKKKTIIIPLIIIIIVLVLLVVGIFVVRPMLLNNSARQNVNDVSNTTDDDENETPLSLEEQAKEMFNNSFLQYETQGDDTLTRTSVSMLFATLANHNEEQGQERKVDVNGIIVTSENLEQLEQILTNDMRYTIKCILDDEGYVKTIELRYVTEDELTSSNDENQDGNNEQNNQENRDENNNETNDQENNRNKENNV